MEKYKDHEDIIALLKRYLEDNDDEPTNVRIEEWLQESERNQELFRRIKSREVLAEKLRFCEQADMNKDWDAIYHKTKISSSPSLFRYWYRYVAVIVGMGLIAGLLYSGWEKESKILPIAKMIFQDSILPGTRQAYIELATGERIRLGDTLRRVEKKVEGGKFVEGGEGLVVTADNTSAPDVQTTRFNKLQVPKGGEYELVLADGTRVWLNSDSELEFPLAFNGEKRLVRLKGEAYFDVKHDEKRPFQVELEGMEILVLGTSFNAFAYGKQVNTTLVKGSVEIHSCGKSYRLIPGEQASLADGKVKIEKVDVGEQIGWKEGKFIFRSKRLEEVMTILARWYNLDIVYQNDAVKNLHFTGNIPRHATITELLNILERTNLVNFTVQGRSVLVSE